MFAFSKKKFRTSVFLVVRLIPMFWTSCDICPGFHSQAGFYYLRASLPVCNGFLRFISGVTSTDLLMATWRPSLFDPYTSTKIYKNLWDSNMCATKYVADMLTISALAIYFDPPENPGTAPNFKEKVGLSNKWDVIFCLNVNSETMFLCFWIWNIKISQIKISL